MSSASVLLLLAISSTATTKAFVPYATPKRSALNGAAGWRRDALHVTPQWSFALADFAASFGETVEDSDVGVDMNGDGAPSDYDSFDLASSTAPVSTDKTDERVQEDSVLRESLKKDLFMLAAKSNRGQHATKEEKNMAFDLVAQMEALNPTTDPAALSNSEGDWQLVLTLTQPFRVSPFFQSIRAALGEDNVQTVNTGFEIHDVATTASRICKVRQSIATASDVAFSGSTLTSEVELQVGAVPGLPFRVEGTVITTASLKEELPSTWNLKIENTVVKQSNVVFLNQFLDDPKVELPWNRLYEQLGDREVPVVKFVVTYIDEGLRVIRDVDDHFYVFSKLD